MKPKRLAITLIVLMVVLTGTNASSFKGLISKRNVKPEMTAWDKPAVFVPTNTNASVKYLPTVVNRTMPSYRDPEIQRHCKYEFKYDEYGNITELKQYNDDSGSLKLSDTYKYEYFRLPNGRFVKTRQENSYQRYTAAYDNKGMMLFEKYEYYSDGAWIVSNWIESVLTNGIRTGIRKYNTETGTMENNSVFTFDDKGRVKSSTVHDELEGHIYSSTYTWDDNDKLIAFTEGYDNDIATYSNVQYVLNCQYINPYGLEPITQSDRDSETSDYPSIYFNSWEEDLNPILISADITYKGLTGKMTSTVNQDGTEMTNTAVLDGRTYHKTVMTITKNGGETTYNTQAQSLDDNGSKEEVDIQTYMSNQYGDLIMESNEGFYLNEDGTTNSYDRKTMYERQYNAQGQLTQTVSRDKDGKVNYSDVCSDWTAMATSTNDAKLESLSVYPNPVQDGFYINNLGNQSAILYIYDMQGRILLHKMVVENEYIDISSLSQGVYFVKVNDKMAKLLKK